MDNSQDLRNLADLEILPLHSAKKSIHTVRQKFFDLLLKQRTNLLQNLFSLLFFGLLLTHLRLLEEVEEVSKLEGLLSDVALVLNQLLDAVAEHLEGENVILTLATHNLVVEHRHSLRLQVLLDDVDSLPKLLRLDAHFVELTAFQHQNVGFLGGACGVGD